MREQILALSPRSEPTTTSPRSGSARPAWSTATASSTTRRTSPGSSAPRCKPRSPRRPGLPTVVDNDANAAAWGELAHGAARGVRDALVITLGTGIGGGIVNDGRVLRGAHGFAGRGRPLHRRSDGPLCACGEVGHWEARRVGDRARADGAGSGATRRCADGAEAWRVVIPKRCDGTHVTEAARAGDPDALALIDRYAGARRPRFRRPREHPRPRDHRGVGRTRRRGRSAARPGPERSSTVTSRVRSYRPTPPIVAAELGDRAGTIGAAAMARELVG